MTLLQTLLLRCMKAIGLETEGGDISKGKGGLERDLWLKGSQGAAQERMLKSKTLANLL